MVLPLDSEALAGRARAAQYLRVSTERQEYSTTFQQASLAAHAVAAGYDIVRTYADEGISGLTLDKRAGLKALLADVLEKRADYDVLLVYDVSRWGRFQDPDEGAHYEFICKAGGVRVEYCAEPFSNDGSLAATLIKNIKRAMAAEYSRDLSSKIRWGQRNAAAMGLWTGGPPGYGYRRQLVKRSGELGPVMQWQEHKFAAGYRVILTPGPPEERAVVRQIFRRYVREGWTGLEISRDLNSSAIPAEGGAQWNAEKVSRLLQNPKYIGHTLRGRVTNRLGEPARRAAPPLWRLQENTHEPLISRRLFNAAQRERERRQVSGWSDDRMLEALRDLLARTGYLSANLIDETPRVPCASTYQARFGSLIEVYRRVGYDMNQDARVMSLRAFAFHGQRRSGMRPVTNDALLEVARSLLQRHGYISQRLVIEEVGSAVCALLGKRFGGFAGLYQRLGYTPTARQAAAIKRRPSREGSHACICARILGAQEQPGRARRKAASPMRSPKRGGKRRPPARDV